MEDNWVVIRACNALHEAELLRSALAADGIVARIPDQHTIGVHPGATFALGGVRVMVPRADLTRAEEVLAEGE